MALHYTRRIDEVTERDVPAEEFINKMVDMKRTTEQRRKVDFIESSK